jgi:L-ascorbate metabolism protein UlaG (beta-lactamase superfamily)
MTSNRHRLLALVAAIGTIAVSAAVLGRARSRAEAQGELLATAMYLANEGVLVSAGETRIAFDPVFRVDHGEYQSLPAELERALFAGEPPFDGLDAVFVSHYHDDHFSPRDLLRLMQARPGLRLYAPAQAVATMQARNPEGREALSRATGIELALGDPPFTLEAGPLVVEAFRIPHTGWPDHVTNVHNLAFRVTLGGATVVHLGDADTSDLHFAPQAERWAARQTHLALPPFWFFLSPEGRRVLEERLAPDLAVGIHVPVEMPLEAGERPEALREQDLFQTPGETREIRAAPAGHR